jgi:hypothetical protein
MCLIKLTYFLQREIPPNLGTPCAFFFLKNESLFLSHIQKYPCALNTMWFILEKKEKMKNIWNLFKCKLGEKKTTNIRRSELVNFLMIKILKKSEMPNRNKNRKKERRLNPRKSEMVLVRNPKIPTLQPPGTRILFFATYLKIGMETYLHGATSLMQITCP